MSVEPLLSIKDLSVTFQVPGDDVDAVRGVSFDIAAGETLALVGESGSGKSVTALSILQLLPYPVAFHPSGSIIFKDEELIGANGDRLQRVRGGQIAMIFQEPMTSLNPLMMVGKQIEESILEHEGCSKSEAQRRAVDLMDLVGIPEPATRARQYPFQLSGGMRQRIVIAIALACRPQALIADEPTTALDVTIQAQVLDLINTLKTDIGMGVILITHDLGVVAEWAQRVMVMYAGRKVEEADVETFFSGPSHPYSQALLASVPRPDAAIKDGVSMPLSEIPGTVPPMNQLGKGCSFADRCTRRTSVCDTSQPEMETLPSGTRVACFHAGESE